MTTYRLLIVNPGSTSTKIAIFEGDKNVFQKNLKHSRDELSAFASITDQDGFRKEIVLNEVKTAGYDVNKIDAVIGRGGLVKPIPSGIYLINEVMRKDLRNSPLGEHASNLGGLIADDIAKSIGRAKAYIADPVVVDEMEDIARVSGNPNFKRISIFHALNQKAIARTFAKEAGKNYNELNLIVAHLGGGISVGAHRKGKVIDVNNALDGDGAFSPERSGGLPVGQLAKLCFSGNYSLKEVKKMIKGEGGLVGYLGTNDAYEVELRIEKGDKKAEFIFDAMAYQVAKEIGSMAAVLKGEVDGILMTGGIAHSKMFVEFVEKMTGFVAPVKAYPGEDEMEALAKNGLMVLNNEIEPAIYK
ncbi:MAG: butyrate kinase [Bacteroidota bacterium]|nr:butyrate kinase [Bacteroidota bacterium]